MVALHESRVLDVAFGAVLALTADRDHESRRVEMAFPAPTAAFVTDEVGLAGLTLIVVVTVFVGLVFGPVTLRTAHHPKRTNKAVLNNRARSVVGICW